MTPYLSILCPSFRRSFLDQSLLTQVNSAKYRDQVEFICFADNDWTSLGQKMVNLWKWSCGEYVMFVADDDIVSPRMLPLVLDKLNPEKVETVTFNIRMIPPTSLPTICKINPGWFEDKPGVYEDWLRDVQLKPWHPIMPTHRSMYVGVEIDNLSWGEDRSLTQQMVPLLKRYVHIDEELYTAFPRATQNKPTSPRYGR